MKTSPDSRTPTAGRHKNPPGSRSPHAGRPRNPSAALLPAAVHPAPSSRRRLLRLPRPPAARAGVQRRKLLLWLFPPIEKLPRPLHLSIRVAQQSPRPRQLSNAPLLLRALRLAQLGDDLLRESPRLRSPSPRAWSTCPRRRRAACPIVIQARSNEPSMSLTRPSIAVTSTPRSRASRRTSATFPQACSRASGRSCARGSPGFAPRAVRGRRRSAIRSSPRPARSLHRSRSGNRRRTRRLGRKGGHAGQVVLTHSWTFPPGKDDAP